MAKFVPLPEIAIDKEHTLEQITGPYQSLNDGLPELVKNSKDHYARLRVTDREQRQILVVFSNNDRHLGVLDFGGAAKADFKGWKTWSSRVAGRADMADDIEAEQGNGGKGFMVRAAETEAFMCGCRDGKRTQMGFRNDEPDLRFRAGFFIENGKELDDVPEPDPIGVLDRLLRPLGFGTSALPQFARDILHRKEAFTLVFLRDVRELKATRSPDKVIAKSIENLRRHPQAARTIETCEIRIMKGRRLLTSDALGPEDIEPKNGFEDPWKFDLPVELADPDTSDRVTVPNRRESDALTIHSSEKNLRMGRLQHQNVIRIRNQRNIIASWSVADMVSSSSAGHVYGELLCSGLGQQHQAGAGRHYLAETPLTRALEHWVQHRVKEVVSEIQAAEMERVSDPEMQAASRALDKLRDLMRDFIRDPSGASTGYDDENGPHGSIVRRFGDRIDEIDLEGGKDSIAAPVGARIPLRYTCYEIADDKRLPVPNPELLLRCANGDVVSWTGNNLITANEPGTHEIWLESGDANVASNRVHVTAWSVRDVKVSTPGREFKQGERRKLHIKAETPHGVKLDDLYYEASVDETDMGKIGRAGHFTAGGIAGTATVRIRYGAGRDDEVKHEINIGQERVEIPSGKGGSDIPVILLCGQTAPGREDWPTEDRTHAGGESCPTIIDWDPVWTRRSPEVIWINHKSRESLKIRSGRGPKELIGLDTQTFMDYLVLKCFEVLRRLWVRQELAGKKAITYQNFIERLSEAETETARFLDLGFEIAEDLVGGTSS